MLQPDDLILTQESPVPALKFLFVESSVHRTIKLHHIVTERLEYSSDDTIPSDVQLDSDSLSVFRDHCQIVNNGAAFFQMDAIEDLLKVSFRQRFIELSFINL